MQARSIKATNAMETLQQLPTHGDGLLNMREPAHTPGDRGKRDHGRAGRHGLRGRGHRAQRLPRARARRPVGDIVLRIPKLRAGTYFPEGLIERYSRADRAVAAAVAESWANGVSTRKMERVARKMG